MKELLILSLFPILVITSIWDLKTKKVPNALIFLGLMLGMGVSFSTEGWSGLGYSLLAMFFVFLIFLPTWGAIAAGDIKLFIVIASFTGVANAVVIGVLSFVIGALFFVVKNPNRAKQVSRNVIYFMAYKVPIQPQKKVDAVAFSPFILMSASLILII